MADHCIQEKELGAMQNCISRLDKEIFGNGKKGLSDTVPEMSTKIDTLIETVSDLRTTVSGFAKFEASYQATEAQKHRGFAKSLQVIGVLIAFGSLLIAFVIMSNKTTTKVRDMIDQYGYDMHTRGGDTLNIM